MRHQSESQMCLAVEDAKGLSFKYWSLVMHNLKVPASLLKEHSCQYIIDTLLEKSSANTELSSDMSKKGTGIPSPTQGDQSGEFENFKKLR